MPGYRAHMVGGLAAFGCLASVLLDRVEATPLVILTWAVASVLGSLFPDIDTKSKGQGIFYKALFVCLILLLCNQNGHLFVLMSFIALVPLLVRHRGIFHAVWFVTLVPLVVAYAVGDAFPAYRYECWYLGWFFAAGALSHIALDRMF